MRAKALARVVGKDQRKGKLAASNAPGAHAIARYFKAPRKHT